MVWLIDKPTNDSFKSFSSCVWSWRTLIESSTICESAGIAQLVSKRCTRVFWFCQLCYLRTFASNVWLRSSWYNFSAILSLLILSTISFKHNQSLAIIIELGFIASNIPSRQSFPLTTNLHFLFAYHLDNRNPSAIPCLALCSILAKGYKPAVCYWSNGKILPAAIYALGGRLPNRL